jgi:N-methylhydantoinase B
VLPAKGAFDAPPGSLIEMITPGSGGFGNPDERDRAAIARDLEEGYVTRDGVRRDYGYDPEEC